MKWSIQNKVYSLPFKTKEEVVRFVNTDIKVCPHCNKVDVSLSHVDKCNDTYDEKKLDNLWK